MIVYLQVIETAAHRSKFEELYRAYRGLMFHVAYSLLQHPQDAEDVVHGAFVRVAENIASIEWPGPRAKSYVLTITERGAIDLLRKRERREELPLEGDKEGMRVEGEGCSHLAECILSLPPAQRQVIWLKYYHGYSLGEIARLLDITCANAAKLHQRAKAKLKELYGEGEG